MFHKTLVIHLMRITATARTKKAIAKNTVLHFLCADSDSTFSKVSWAVVPSPASVLSRSLPVVGSGTLMPRIGTVGGIILSDFGFSVSPIGTSWFRRQCRWNLNMMSVCWSRLRRSPPLVAPQCNGNATSIVGPPELRAEPTLPLWGIPVNQYRVRPVGPTHLITPVPISRRQS